MKEQIKRTDKLKKSINVFIRDKVRLKKKVQENLENESSNTKSK